MIRAPKSGDRYRVPVCVTTDWRVRRDVVVDVKAVQRLGCSCTRLTVDRPGPASGELAGPMHLFVGPSDEQRERIQQILDQIEDVVVVVHANGEWVTERGVRRAPDANPDDLNVWLRGKDKHTLSINVPLSWAVSVVKQAGYRVFQEM